MVSFRVNGSPRRSLQRRQHDTVKKLRWHSVLCYVGRPKRVSEGNRSKREGWEGGEEKMGFSGPYTGESGRRGVSEFLSKKGYKFSEVANPPSRLSLRALHAMSGTELASVAPRSWTWVSWTSNSGSRLCSLRPKRRRRSSSYALDV